MPSVVPPEGSSTRLPPSTSRGVRTRASLVSAARTVFERDGYLDSRLTDITAEANCSTGSFYTYFDSKEEIFAAVLEVAKEDMMHPPSIGNVEVTDDPRVLIEAGNRAYFEAYARNAKLMGLLQQVASIDPEFAEVRRRRSTQFLERNARSIARMQAQGLADPDLDPQLTSTALSAMVSRLGFYTYVLGEPASLDDLVEITTRIWCNALKLAPVPD